MLKVLPLLFKRKHNKNNKNYTINTMPAIPCNEQQQRGINWSPIPFFISKKKNNTLLNAINTHSITDHTHNSD